MTQILCVGKTQFTSHDELRKSSDSIVRNCKDVKAIHLCVKARSRSVGELYRGRVQREIVVEDEMLSIFTYIISQLEGYVTFLKNLHFVHIDPVLRGEGGKNCAGCIEESRRRRNRCIFPTKKYNATAVIGLVT